MFSDLTYWHIGGFLLSALAGILLSRAVIRPKYRGRVSEARQSQAELQRYLDIIDKHVIYSRTDLDWRITHASEAFAKISGYSSKELIGKPLAIFRSQDLTEDDFETIREQIVSEGRWSGELKHTAADGGYYWVSVEMEGIYDQAGNLTGFSQIRHDITSRKRLEQLWMTDQLTGLSNRTHIDQLLDYQLKRSNRYGTALSIMLLDIDHFKQVNDTHGHLVGDDLLYGFANLLKRVCREVDLIGRWGGEEFIILLPDTDLSGAVLLAEKVRAAIENQTFPVIGHITASIGIASHQSGLPQDTLFRLADEALYRAKRGGRNRVEVGFRREP